MQNERSRTAENGKLMRKTYLVTWDEEPERISKKTGKPCKERYQTIDPVLAERVYEARIEEGKKNVEIAIEWD